VIAVTSRLVARPGREPQLEKLLGELAAQVRSREAGCALFLAARSPHDPRIFLLIERYVDALAHAAHANAEHFAAALPDLMECLEGHPEIALFHEL